MTEKEKFERRLEEKRQQGLISWGVSWGPDAENMTEEERYAALNRLQDSIDRGDCARKTAKEIDEETLGPGFGKNETINRYLSD